MDEEREREIQPQADQPDAASIGRADELGPGVIEGEDDIPRQPAPKRDPFVPEPGARAGETRAWNVMRLAWIPLAIAIAIVVYAIVR